MNSSKTVEDAIKSLRENFKASPDYFFNEHDFHHKFFCILYSKFENVLHPEYPTRKRFVKEKGDFESYVKGVHCFEPNATNKGRRGHYDFVIFKETFYNMYKDSFEILSNKKVETNLKIKDKYLDYALEFKYITSGSKSVIGEVEFDIFKLEQSEEAEKKYLIIFIRRERMSEKGFRQIIEPLTEFQKSRKDVEILIEYGDSKN